MILVLLPGLDGTGELFAPFLATLPQSLPVQVISYPNDQLLPYKELESFVRTCLPKNQDFVLLAESFSGPIAYRIASNPPANLKQVIFVATFLKSPHPILLKLALLFPLQARKKLSFPRWIENLFLLDKSVGEDLRQVFRKDLSQLDPKLVAFRLREISRLVFEKHRINLPVTYLRARNDWLVPKSSLNRFQEVCRHLTTYEIAGPHFLLQINPRACVDVLINSPESPLYHCDKMDYAKTTHQ